ncbi:MAG: hypothetical protein ACRCX2_19485 [Paraclostridium sp.]
MGSNAEILLAMEIKELKSELNSMKREIFEIKDKINKLDRTGLKTIDFINDEIVAKLNEVIESIGG